MAFNRKEYLRNYQRKWLNKRREDWIKKNGPCVKCGSTKNLEVDHINRLDNVQRGFWSWSFERREAELKKCQVLCEVCHQKKTTKEMKELFKGKPNIAQRSVSNENLKKVLDLINAGLSERKACKKVGIKRGTYSSIKIRNMRPEVFDSGMADN